jgi:hypothetical protein
MEAGGECSGPILLLAESREPKRACDPAGDLWSWKEATVRRPGGTEEQRIAKGACHSRRKKGTLRGDRWRMLLEHEL